MFSTVTLSKLVLASLVATAYAATTRYNTPLPESATVLDTENEIRQFTVSNPNVTLETANGGYTVQEFDGTVLAYVGDNLSKNLDERMKSLERFENRSKEKRVSDNDESKVFEAANACSHPTCVYPGVPGKCAHYSGCYICAHSRRCI